MTHKKTFRFITTVLAFGLLTSISSGVSAADKVPYSSANCKKVSGMSKGTQESVSKKLRVSASSVRLYSIGGNSNGCTVKFDTAKGIKDVWIQDWNGGIYTDGTSYWIHWSGI